MSYLHDALIYLVAAVAAVPIAKRLGFGSVLGYLVAGIVIGPAALGLITEVESILHFAELGVVLLLFIIGLELQPSRLWVLRRMVFGLGTAQVMVTGLVLTGIAAAAGLAPNAAFVAGFGLALSSTAFVLQLLAEKGELTASHGRSGFAILLFQDLAVIPLIAIVPMLGAGAADMAALNAGRVLATLAAVAALVVGGRWLLRPALRIVARAESNDLFTATALLVVIGAAFLADLGGLSMGLGAFVAGMLLADSEFRHELEADIEPFKGLLLGLFFIAVGMSVDLGLIVERPGDVLGLTAALLLVKAAILAVLGRVFGLGGGTSRNLAVVLSQGGEFAFVLFTLAAAEGALPGATADLLIVVVTLSMAMTPVLFLLNKAWERRMAPAEEEEPEYDDIDEANPVIIAGFGRFGQIVARILRLTGIPFTALEINSEWLEVVRRFGNRVHFGDASRLDLLEAAGADRAKIFVLAIDDVEASVNTARAVRNRYPKLRIFARARNRQHAYRLIDLGCQVIYREMLHSSLRMSREVLENLGYSEEEAKRIVETFERHDEQTLRRQQAVSQDEEKLIKTSKEAMAELESLFESDNLRRGRNPG